MATALTADQLVAVLKAEGLVVHEVRDWRHHNRNAKGDWGPVNGVMLHHTVTSGTASSVDLCYDGSSDLPGPLCHGVIDKKGEVWLVGNGRTNHAGGGDPRVLAVVIAEQYTDRPPVTHEHQGSSGAVDGNSHFYGFECINLGDGMDPWPAVQVNAMVKASAAICRAHEWSAKSVIGHLEWSDEKSDPRGAAVAMPDMRAKVAECLKAKPGAWAAPARAKPAPAPVPAFEQRMAALEKRIAALESRVK